ncbi:MAG: lipid II flippase MurJ, partial [Paracoccaceae bacterium]|nr:lipid II flippase MurJ [Paracoccaceae bacterium]
EAATFDERLLHRVPRLALASVLMGVALYGLRLVLADQLLMPGWRYLALAALVFGGMLAYAVAAVATGAIRPGDVRSSLGRQR